MKRSTIVIAGSLCVIGLGIAALAAGTPSGSPATDASTPGIEAVQLLPCPDPDISRSCEFDHVKTPEYLAEALKGDYQAQRNVSASHTSAARWIVQRPIQGCAWRMVIMVSRPADAEYDDEGMYRIQCSHLSAADLGTSKRLAGVIYQRIHGASLPALPAIPT